MNEDYIPRFTRGDPDEVWNISNLIHCYFREWDIQIKIDPRMGCTGILQNTNYNSRKAVIFVNPQNIQEKAKDYDEQRREVFLTIFHEVLHIDPDFDPRRLYLIASQMNVDLGNERCNRIFQFLTRRFASTWYIEDYLDDCAEKVYNQEKDETWIKELWNKYNLERIVSWKEDKEQLEFGFMN